MVLTGKRLDKENKRLRPLLSWKKVMNKHHITVDNSYILLYTVCEVGKNMRIIINNSSMVPIYEQVVSQIKNAIITGEMKDGEILPSVRTLAAELRISSLTVKKAYDSLEEEGFITTVHGKGSFVNDADRQLAYEARRKAVEDELSAVIEKAFSAGMTKEEIREIVDLIMED